MSDHDDEEDFRTYRGERDAEPDPEIPDAPDLASVSFGAVLRYALPPHASKIESLPEAEGRAWDERVKRLNEGTATEEDERIHRAAEKDLAAGRPLSPEARAMPREKPRRFADEAKVVSIGVPPLIARRIIAGEVFETRSTRACKLVGRDCMILVMIGVRGCGKTVAASEWLWTSPGDAPHTMRGRTTPRRLVEAAGLFDVPFSEHSKLNTAIALVVDDAGTEHDSLINQWANIFIARYRNALPTVITTNLSEKEFNDRYGMRFADRMRELGKFVVVANEEKDSLRGRD